MRDLSLVTTKLMNSHHNAPPMATPAMMVGGREGEAASASTEDIVPKMARKPKNVAGIGERQGEGGQHLAQDKPRLDGLLQ